MDLENNEEDCTIYIEELKSDDPNLKINAVSKVNNIADILGSSRTREELIPYIMEIIEECDNEDEFLIKLADQLLSLKDLLGGKEYSYMLIAPLELLASMEENLIREKAVECLRSLAQSQEKSFFSTYFFQMIKQLGNWDIYQSRVSCCFLLNSCYPHISSTQQLELRQLFSELARDDTPMVRRAVAANLSSFGSVIEKTLIKSELLPLWQLLIKDDIDSVKIKAIESSNFFVSNLRKDEANNAMITLLKNIDNEKKSWRVRYALAEVLPSMLGSLDKETILKEIVDIYENFMNDTEPEVKSIAALKFPEIAEKMNEKMIIDRIIPILKNLAEDTNQHVRHALAQILVKIAKFLDVRNIIEYFVPIITQIYKDEFLDVRLALIETFGNFHQLIGANNVKQYIIPLVTQAKNEKNWRSRLAIVEYLPKLSEEIGFNLFQDQIQNFMNEFLFDHYHAIRGQAIENLARLCVIFGYDKIKNMISDGLKKLSQSNNYLFRISGLNALIKLKEIIEINDLKNLWKEFAEKMKSDNIANVRLNVLKCFIEIKNKLNENEKKNYKKILEILKKDKDADVSYWASQL